jgi:alkanesulfonate monooxygenase SsuD/methylene tetrahydromethanopterin reductase-like flavin-dependent oxidoreductase (luciferase family)
MTAERRTQRGLGLAASTPSPTIRAAVDAVDTAGYHSFWLNNPPNGGAIPILGRIAPSVPRLWLGVGVVPLPHHTAHEIAEEVETSTVPLDRFYLGIGSGTGNGGVARVAEGIDALRNELNTSIVVAALGPRMCRLAGEQADGVLLNWLTPDFARTSIEWIAEGAHAAGRSMPRLMAYVRVALGDAATARLHAEGERYESYPAYAAHFKRMGVGAAGASIFGASASDLLGPLAAWNGIVDELVIRAIATDETPGAVVELIKATAPNA